MTRAHADPLCSYEVITTPTDVIMVMEYAGEELFNYIVAKGKGGVSSFARPGLALLRKAAGG